MLTLLSLDQVDRFLPHIDFPLSVEAIHPLRPTMRQFVDDYFALDRGIYGSPEFVERANQLLSLAKTETSAMLGVEDASMFYVWGNLMNVEWNTLRAVDNIHGSFRMSIRDGTISSGQEAPLSSTASRIIIKHMARIRGLCARLDAAEYNPNEWEAHVFELKTWEFAYGRKDPLPITPYDRLYSLVNVVQMEKLFEALQANTDEKQFRAVVDLIGDHPHWVRWGKSKALSAESMKYLDLPYLREVFASLGVLAN